MRLSDDAALALAGLTWADLTWALSLGPLVNDLRGQQFERQHLVGRPELDRLARHAEHHGGRLVLRDREGAGHLHFLQAARAVIAHAGHDDADRIAAGILCRRAK